MTLLLGLGVITAYVSAIVSAYLLRGWALVKLWGWFILPLGLPPLSISWAIGLTAIAGLLEPAELPKEDGKIDILKAWIICFVKPLLCVFVGWIVQRYMH